MKTLISNAIIPHLDLHTPQALGIIDKQIAFIGDVPTDFIADTQIDAEGQYLLPGLVDLGAWLREPGLDYKAVLATETYAAASSGITTLCYQPEPQTSVDNAAQVHLIQGINNRLGYTNICVIGNLTQQLEGERLSNMGSLKRAGCIGVSNGWMPMKNLQVQRLAMEYATTHGLTVFSFPLEHALAGEGVMHEGALSTRLGFAGIPSAAETIAVSQTLALLELTGTKVHFCRLSSEGSVRLIRQAKANGLNVSADVAAHQLFLTEMDLSDFNPLCHVKPPLRSERDREALLEGLADGTIDAICSDHQPHDLDAKLAPLQQTEPGISALETLLPLALRLVEQDVLSWPQLIDKLCLQPAQLIGSQAGHLATGAPADLTLLNKDQLWELHTDIMHSMGKNTPLIGWSLQGKITRTWLAGRNIYQLNND